VSKKKKVKISKDTEQIVEALTKETKKAEEVAEKIMFVSKIQQLGMAIGGALLFSGFVLFATFGLIIVDMFPIAFQNEYKFIVSVLVVLTGLLHALGGIALISK
jgi:hypothetical protein